MEFREMRRKKQQLPEGEVERILEQGTYCILGVIGDGGYPYTVPVNYAYKNEKIIFHCAKAGHKVDALRNCNQVSACVVANDDVIGEKLTTAFSSVIVFGKARILENRDEIIDALITIGTKFSTDRPHIEHEAESSLDRVCCVEIDIEHIAGKEGLELKKMRKKAASI